jgi:hypothetical protein
MYFIDYLTASHNAFIAVAIVVKSLLGVIFCNAVAITDFFIYADKSAELAFDLILFVNSVLSSSLR